MHPLLVSSLDNMARRLRDGYRYRMAAGTCPSCTCRRCDPRFPIIRLRRNGSATVGVSKSESWSRGVIWDDEGSSTSRFPRSPSSVLSGSTRTGGLSQAFHRAGHGTGVTREDGAVATAATVAAGGLGVQGCVRDTRRLVSAHRAHDTLSAGNVAG